VRDVIRIVCPHGLVATFVHDQGIWTAVITNTQTARDSETGEFIEYRYPVRCEACGKPGHPIVGDANQGTLNEALNHIDREGIEPVTLALRVGGRPRRWVAPAGTVTLVRWVDVLGRLDKMRHA